MSEPDRWGVCMRCSCRAYLAFDQAPGRCCCGHVMLLHIPEYEPADVSPPPIPRRALLAVAAGVLIVVCGLILLASTLRIGA